MAIEDQTLEAEVSTGPAAEPARDTPPPTLRESLEKAIEKVGTDEVPDKGPVAEAKAKTPPAGDKVDDQATSAQKPKPAPGKDPAEVTETALEKQERESQSKNNVDRAPQSWKAPIKAKWNTIDPEVRGEIMRRERDTDRALTEASAARRFAQGFETAVKPHFERWKAAGLTPTRAVEGLMQADLMLSTAPPQQRAGYMAKLIKDYGIDINALDEALSGQVSERVNPEDLIAKVVDARLAPLMSERQQREQQAQEARQRNFEQQQSTVESYKNNPDFPHFEALQEEMADIIEINLRRGRTVSLEQAYNLAVQSNPETAAEAAQRSKQNQAQNLNTAARRAMGASLSVSGTPAMARQREVDPNNLRATIEAAALQHQGR